MSNQLIDIDLGNLDYRLGMHILEYCIANGHDVKKCWQILHETRYGQNLTVRLPESAISWIMLTYQH